MPPSKGGRKHFLPREKIAEFGHQLALRALRPSMATSPFELRSLVKSLAGQEFFPSQKVLRGVLKDVAEIGFSTSLRRTEDRNHAKSAASVTVMQEWMKSFHRKFFSIEGAAVLGAGFDPAQHIANCDETMINFKRGATYCYALKGQTHCYTIPATFNVHITLLIFIMINGMSVPPIMIVGGAQDARRLVVAGWPAMIVTSTESGFINTTIFAEAIGVFANHVRGCLSANSSMVPAPLVLVADNHSTRDTEETHAACIKHRVHLSLLPPNTTDRMQPLDARNGPNQELKKSLRKHLAPEGGRPISLAAAQIALLAAYREAVTIKRTVNAFIDCGFHKAVNIDVMYDGEGRDQAAVLEHGSAMQLTAAAVAEAQTKNAEAAEQMRRTRKRKDKEAMNDAGVVLVDSAERLAAHAAARHVVEAEAERKRIKKEEAAKLKQQREEQREMKQLMREYNAFFGPKGDYRD